MSSRTVLFLVLLAVAVGSFAFFDFSSAPSREEAGRFQASEIAIPELPAPVLEPAPEPEQKQTATLLFVGDIMLSRNIGKIMAERDDWRYPFLRVADTLASADLTFGNLEGPISSRGVKQGSIYSFRADPRSAEGLAHAGFDVVSLANNHMWDYGKEAFLDTLDALTDADISYAGGGADFKAAHWPAVWEHNGMKVAFLAYTNLIPISFTKEGSQPATAFIDVAQMTADIQSAKAQADVVVASFHWGEEYKTAHNAEQERIAKTAIDAGALLVIGHHPHVPQEVERYNGGVIAYSLGNFVFDQNFSQDTRTGLALRVTIAEGAVESVEEMPVKFTPDFQPYFAVPAQ
ncbi:hypothetical protein A2988_00700 [Candidatus Azambacteria bacterium RIFCSPLOWO2_01_FULL_46_25]|uniref:Capsule synthesis protein CapA domain-containing protein n=1 Tax=Candidatus Azambacteria bacterium RIFCSPLOWO2_01_FULL_46_25 TaxID=1797298 RepID=A0A1F5BTP4_9BACT|nr:MAG: hypothetical protein A2988_00700 [Candidatus Azambacteria bacterium RIFCSPLOWO2_01_FULL_46_25]OGD37202.1 MAG: hypothetical protein A2850_02560 [Candidatus Azambacteria bacterium RIFCSPHIGHO2_01_FULL_51_74]